MINEEALAELRATLEADGYRLDADEVEGRIRVQVSATSEACADCLVPKPVFLGILRNSLGVSEQSIDLTYPADEPS
ncbi:MAG: hypothetical protein GEU98_15170 [Pseudonocardiaceae bacterium]|nr:hypothetical protein [Pseudonocardiaceae bacterium]